MATITATTTITTVPTSDQPSGNTLSTSSTFIPRGPVTADLSFYQPPSDNSIPFNYVETPPPSQPQRNFSDTIVATPITDLRGQENAFNLDTNAFAVIPAPSPCNSTPTPEINFASDESIKTNYYPEITNLLKNHLPTAYRIQIFDHTIRGASPNAPRNPVTRVHIDQTASSAAARVRLHAPSEDAFASTPSILPKTRIRIINIWRPLNGPVQSFPLAFADSTTVPDSAIVPVEHRYPHRTGETAAVKSTEGQRWYYLSGMEDTERLLLQCFVSEGGARVPHSAFLDPRTPAGARGRESIEVRALVFG